MLYGTARGRKRKRRRRRRREQPGILTYRVAEEKVRVRVECVIRFEELPSAEGGDAAKKRKEKLEKRKRKEREKIQKKSAAHTHTVRHSSALFSKHRTSWRHLVFRPASCSSALPSFAPSSLSPSKCAILRRRRRLLLSQYIIYIYIYKCTIEPTRNLLLHDSLERFIVWFSKFSIWKYFGLYTFCT